MGRSLTPLFEFCLSCEYWNAKCQYYKAIGFDENPPQCKNKKALKIPFDRFDCYDGNSLLIGSSYNLSSKSVLMNVRGFAFFVGSIAEKATIFRASKEHGYSSILSNAYQYSVLILYRHPVYGWFFSLQTSHESGDYESLVFPVYVESPLWKVLEGEFE